jgi:2'-5' RNA ligase
MRTFIAIPLSEGCREMLAAIQDKLRSFNADIRWASVSSIHLTLKFLGEMDPVLLPQLSERLRQSSALQPAFDLRVRGLGGFPNLRSPRVVWCGLEGETDRLGKLQEVVEQACEPLGFPREARDFHPHLTLGRVQGKRNLQPLLDYIKIGSDLESSLTAREFNIYKSVLTPRGAIYTVLDTIRLST